MNDKIIYRINERISFRKCSLSEGPKQSYGDCTNFTIFEKNYEEHYSCNDLGIHLHCTKHPEIEFNYELDECPMLICKKCGDEIYI